jgi:hypothetical protein
VITVSRTTHALCVPTGRKLLLLGDFINSSLSFVYVSQAQFGSNITQRNYRPRRDVYPQLQRSRNYLWRQVQSLASLISKINQQPGRSVGTNELSKPVASRSGVYANKVTCAYTPVTSDRLVRDAAHRA